MRIEEDCWRVRLGCRGCQHEQHICDIDVSVGEVRMEELHLNSARSLLLCDLQSVRKCYWELTAQQTQLCSTWPPEGFDECHQSVWSVRRCTSRDALGMLRLAYLGDHVISVSSQLLDPLSFLNQVLCCWPIVLGTKLHQNAAQCASHTMAT